MQSPATAGLPARRGRAWPRIAVGAAVLAVAAGVLAGLALDRGGARTNAAAVVNSRHGLDGMATWAAGARRAPAISGLHDQRGRPFALAQLSGRAVALVFFDSHCHQECPLEGHALAAAEQSLRPAARPVLVAVSVNPADTPASDRQAVREWGLAGLAPWHWLMGTHQVLKRVYAEYHIYVGRSKDGDIPHTEALILIDPRGDMRSAYLYPFATRFVAHDLARLAPRGS